MPEIEEAYVLELIADRDEISLEAEVEALAVRTDLADHEAHYLGVLRHALCRIDALQVEGRYEAERERLHAELCPPMPTLTTEQETALGRNAAAAQNFLDALRSPDGAQRARFESLFRRIAERTPHEEMEILQCLEQAKRKPGPNGRRFSEDEACLSEMKMAVLREGMSPPDAARSVAHRTNGINKGEIVKRLTRAFHDKMRLRTF